MAPHVRLAFLVILAVSSIAMISTAESATGKPRRARAVTPAKHLFIGEANDFVLHVAPYRPILVACCMAGAEELKPSSEASDCCDGISIPQLILQASQHHQLH